MTTRLPFTLHPIPGEPFGLWWHTYATRLDLTRADLARAIGIPTDPIHITPDHGERIASATGLPAARIAAMFTTARRVPPKHVLRVWTPQPTTRYCPPCLAAGSPMRRIWQLPLTFHCTEHDLPLADRCMPCGTPIPTRSQRRRPRCPSCHHDLAHAPTTTTGPNPAHLEAQRMLDRLRTQLRDPDTPCPQRAAAQHQLTDITLIALHLAQRDVGQRRGFTTTTPNPGDLIDATRLSTTDTFGDTTLADLVTRCARGGQAHAVPFSWRSASPALIARIAHCP